MDEIKNKCRPLNYDMPIYCDGKKPISDFLDLILMRINSKKMQKHDVKVFNKHFNKLKNEQKQNR